MKEPDKITISDAAKAYGINNRTLYSWVTKNKVRSEKRTVGKKEVYFIDVASLEAYIKERGLEKAPRAEEKPSLRESPIKTKTSRKRNRPRRKTPRQYVKESMRRLSVTELLNIQQWITQRLEQKIKKSGKHNDS